MAGKVISAMYIITKEPSVFSIGNFPWDENGVKPETQVSVSYDEGGFLVSFVSYETNVRAVETEHNSPVHEDSCMELFAAFASDDDRYINIEVNPNGAAHCELGVGRGDRIAISPEDINTLGIKTAVYGDRWEVSYYIPTSFIQKYLPTYKHGNGTVFKGNFYKCGDKTGHAHYGCFNNIPWQHPDFHRPEFFAEFTLA